MIAGFVMGFAACGALVVGAVYLALNSKEDPHPPCVICGKHHHG